MEREQIILRLKEYQRSENIPSRPQTLGSIFEHGVNSRIKSRHGESAKRAVREALRAMLADPFKSIPCLQAMLQLCRDDECEFASHVDEDLIRRINTDTYFTLLTLEQIFLETQDGVV